MDLFRFHFIWLVCMAHFALCMSSRCVAIFCFIFMVYFLKYVPIPWGGGVFHSFSHPLCLVDKMLDTHFPVRRMMTMTEKHLAMPCLHFFTFLPHPLFQWNCSRAPGCCSQMLLLSLSNIWHCWLFPPSTQICLPWLLWLCFPGVPPIPMDF